MPVLEAVKSVLVRGVGRVVEQGRCAGYVLTQGDRRLNDAEAHLEAQALSSQKRLEERIDKLRGQISQDTKY